MKFTENSALVKVWVRLVTDGEYTREEVPNLANLREVVWAVLDKSEDDEDNIDTDQTDTDQTDTDQTENTETLPE